MWLTFNLYPLKTLIYKAMICFNKSTGNSLTVQWLGLGAFTAVAWVQSLVGELRSRKPHSATKKTKTINKQTKTPKQQCPKKKKSVLKLANEERVFIIICIFISISSQFLDTEIKKHLHFLSSCFENESIRLWGRISILY